MATMSPAVALSISSRVIPTLLSTFATLPSSTTVLALPLASPAPCRPPPPPPAPGVPELISWAAGGAWRACTRSPGPMVPDAMRPTRRRPRNASLSTIDTCQGQPHHRPTMVTPTACRACLSARGVRRSHWLFLSHRAPSPEWMRTSTRPDRGAAAATHEHAEGRSGSGRALLQGPRRGHMLHNGVQQRRHAPPPRGPTLRSAAGARRIQWKGRRPGCAGPALAPRRVEHREAQLLLWNPRHPRPPATDKPATEHDAKEEQQHQGKQKGNSAPGRRSAGGP